MAACEIEFTDEFEAWWSTLTEAEQVAVAGHVDALEQHGWHSASRARPP